MFDFNSVASGSSFGRHSSHAVEVVSPFVSLVAVCLDAERLFVLEAGVVVQLILHYTDL